METTASKISNADLELWEKQIEVELRKLITNVCTLKNQSEGAKTKTKKDYYEKKIKPLNVMVKKLVTVLQKIQLKNVAELEHITT